MAAKGASGKRKSKDVFGHARKPAEMFRAGLYARVSTNDQQTLPMQNRALREYAVRRGWAIAMQVREVGSGAVAKFEREILRERTRAGLARFSPCSAERQTVGKANHCGPSCSRGSQTISRRRQQIRNSAPDTHRPNLGSPNLESEVMKRLKRDPVREDRIHNEAIVDARPGRAGNELVLLSGKQAEFPLPREVCRRQHGLATPER